MTVVWDGVGGFLLARAAGEGRKHLWRWWGGWESRSSEAEAPACWVCRGGAHTAVVLKKLVSGVLGSIPLLFLQGLQKIIYSMNPFIFHSISFLTLSPFTCLLLHKKHSIRSSWVSHLAPHSSTLAWKIPWMEEPGGLQSMGSRRVGHDWATSLSRIGEGNGNPFWCSCLENPRDGGAWWAAVYGVSQSWTRLKRLSSSSSSSISSLIQYLWFEVFRRALEVGRSMWPWSTLASVERDDHSSWGLANAWTTGILWGCIFSFHQFSLVWPVGWV